MRIKPASKTSKTPSNNYKWGLGLEHTDGKNFRFKPEDNGNGNGMGKGHYLFRDCLQQPKPAPMPMRGRPAAGCRHGWC